jgi:hypothetical protein
VAAESGSGHAYVARLRRDRAARDDAQRIARETARAIHHGLVEQAAGAKILRRPTRELAPDADQLVLNGAYLVDTERASEFRALAEELGKRHCPEGMRIEITGPWPPFSFIAQPADERQPSRADLRGR